MEAWRAFEEGDFPRSILRTRWTIGSTWKKPRSDIRWSPPVEVWEKIDSYILRAELPGVKKEDIEIATINNAVTISGMREPPSDIENEEYQRCEICYGPFSRSITFPISVDTDDVNATYEDGILTVELMKVKTEILRKIPNKTK